MCSATQQTALSIFLLSALTQCFSIQLTSSAIKKPLGSPQTEQGLDIFHLFSKPTNMGVSNSARAIGEVRGSAGSWVDSRMRTYFYDFSLGSSCFASTLFVS